MNQRNPAISKGIDWSLVGIYLLLVAIGLTAIFAATYKEGDPVLQSFLRFKTDYSKQFFFFLIGGGIALFILLTDSKFFAATANLGYAFGIFMLMLVFPFHSNIKGTQSIIKLGAFNFQPAEFCKIFVALALAKYLSRPETDFTKTKSQFLAAAIALFPAAITILQSETGLALVYFSFFIVMYREGLPSIIPVNSDNYEMLQTAHEAVARIMVLARSLDGVISGEHGIGITKLEFLTDAELAQFAAYKAKVDPQGHFNRGKLLRPQDRLTDLGADTKPAPTAGP